jgi:hypothetical protein
MQSADIHDVHTLTVADPHCHLVPSQAPLIPRILLGIANVSNKTGIEYPRVTTGTCKIDINYIYIKYTFVWQQPCRPSCIQGTWGSCTSSDHPPLQ